MTERSMNLIEVVRQSGDQDLLRQLAETTLAKLMGFEVAERIFRMPLHYRCWAEILVAASGDEEARIGVLLEVVGATAEQEINADTRLGLEKGAPRIDSNVHRGVGPRHGRHSGASECRRDLIVPTAPEAALPVVLKRAAELGFEKQGYLRSATGDAPIQIKRFAGTGFPGFRERVTDFLAYLFIVR